MASNVDPAPESTLPYPPIHKDKKFVVLSDWLVRLPIPKQPDSPLLLYSIKDVRLLLLAHTGMGRLRRAIPMIVRLRSSPHGVLGMIVDRIVQT